MRKVGRYRTPKEIKDEDIWFKWFTKKQFVYMGISCAVAVFIFMLLQKLRLTLFGAMIAVILVFAGFTIPRFDMPADKYLIGGGMPLEQIIKRILIKNFLQKKNIYVTDHKEMEQ